jgi:hypothetical protein
MVKHSFKISKPLKVQEPLLNKTLDNLNNLLSSKAAKFDTVVSVTEITKPVNEESPIKNSTNKELIYAFSEALLKQDFEAIDSLLLNGGRFMSFDKKGELNSLNKQNYISWLKNKVGEQPVTSFSEDICNGCKIGELAMFFNNGSFPWNVLEQGFGRKAAILFFTSGKKIIATRFCHNFKNKQNRMDYPKYKELYVKYRELGYNIDDTIRLSREEWNK